MCKLFFVCSDAGDDCSVSSGEQTDYASRYHSQSQPDLISISYEDQNVIDYPEHVLKVYKSDQVFKYLLVHKVCYLRVVADGDIEWFRCGRNTSRGCLNSQYFILKYR